MGEGASFQEAMQQAGYLPPDVVVVGADQDRHAALEAARLARLDYPNAQLVFLLTYLDEGYRAQCERAGVSGFVLKTAPSEALTEVLVEAYRAGQRAVASADLCWWKTPACRHNAAAARATYRSPAGKKKYCD